jgi:uncharacterized protein YlxP (DUF503 family)
MIVGVLKLTLRLPENHSLKGKRGVIKRIQARVSDQFNIAVTECGDQDIWQSSVLGFAVVGSSEAVVQATLQNVVAFVDSTGLAELGDSSSEIIHC